jgi:RNA polymerase primary sigma factor
MNRSSSRRSNALTDYLREVEATPLLTIQEEQDSAARVAAGDPQARDRMVRANLRLVVAIARQYLRKGLSLEDLVAEGNLGLVRAVEGFDPSVGTRFSTYAAYWIKQSIRAAVMKLGKFVRLPAHAHTLLNKWRRVDAVLTEQLGRTPTFDEISDALRLTRRKRRLLADVVQASQLVNCSENDGDSDEDAALSRVSAAGRSLDEIMDRSDAYERVVNRLQLLDDRQALVVRLRFGLEGDHGPLSLRDVSERLGGITRERVRQIESQALQILSAGLVDADDRVSA